MRTNQIAIGEVLSHAMAGSTRALLRFLQVDSGQTVSAFATADKVHYSVNLKLEFGATTKLHSQKANSVGYAVGNIYQLNQLRLGRNKF